MRYNDGMKKSSRETSRIHAVRGKEVAYTRPGSKAASRVRPRMEILGAEVAPDVLAFCEREGILDHLKFAGELVAQNFPAIRYVGFSVEVDPETGDESVVIDLSIAGEIDDLVRRSQQFSAAFAAKVPWPELGKISVLQRCQLMDPHDFYQQAEELAEGKPGADYGKRAVDCRSSISRKPGQLFLRQASKRGHLPGWADTGA